MGTKHDEQVDREVAQAGDVNRSDGLGSDHLDFVYVVEVEGREDGTYVFYRRASAARFANAIHCGGGEATFQETPVNAGAAAGRLIAAERGDVLENLDWPELAESMREGVVPSVLLRRLEMLGLKDGNAVERLREWDRLDAKVLEGVKRVVSDGA